ncbi:MAG: sensor histidine kinase [Solirubrobacteraceae bacterium]
MKRRQTALGLFAGAMVVLALLAVFAIELSDTQAKSKRDVQTRVHERGVLAAALIDSLFGTVEQQIPKEERTYGAPVVSTSTMNTHKQTSQYTVLLDTSGHVLAHSSGFSAQAQAALPSSSALALIRRGHPYGLGDVVSNGAKRAIELATAFPTQYGTRILLSGIDLSQLVAFISNDLRKIPGVRGAHNYLIDGNNVVIASTNPVIHSGHAFSSPADRTALAHRSGDINGHYYAHVDISNSTWRVVLAAPDGPLFASVSGLRKWIPWIIFLAFGLVAGAALVLGLRVMASAAEVHDANSRLADLNAKLAGTNATLERRAAELARSNSELEQFASIASHDLQEPLRKVRTFTEYVAVGDADTLSEKGRDYLHRANAAAERMQQLIEDLLKFSRVSTHGRPFAPIDLGQVTREVVDDLEAQVHQAGAKIKIGELPTTNGDALQIRQLMQNLISNALKFRREGVTPEVSIDGTVEAGMAEINVRDNGIGFDPRYRGRIFRVFERLHGRSEYPGTGIGLALCRKIAERHGGTVVADGVPDEGATFTVRLPVNRREEVLVADHRPGIDDAAQKEAYVAA